MPYPIYPSDGKVGIGRPNPEKELDVLGDVQVTGDVVVTGDITADNLVDITLAAFGSTPDAKGATLTAGALALQPADGTHPGAVSTGVQSFGGNKTFTGTVAASNLSGTNTGDITLASVGSSPANAGASLAAQVLTLQPADATHGGVVSTTTQTMAGAKTFSSPVTISDQTANQNALVVSNDNRLKMSSNAGGYIAATSGGLVYVGSGFDAGSNVRIGSGSYYGIQGSSTLLRVLGFMADGASAVGVCLDTSPSYTNAAAKLVSVRNADAEKAFIDKDGNLEISGSNGGYIVLKSPDGTRYKLSIANGGTVSIAAA